MGTVDNTNFNNTVSVLICRTRKPPAEEETVKPLYLNKTTALTAATMAKWEKKEERERKKSKNSKKKKNNSLTPPPSVAKHTYSVTFLGAS